VIDKLNDEEVLDAEKVRDLYAEDILKLQKKMVGVINELEDIEDQNFNSKSFCFIRIGNEFISQPDIQVEEIKDENNPEENKENDNLNHSRSRIVENDGNFSMFSKSFII